MAEIAIFPGLTFRKDSDQTHTPMFHQIEGLVIDKGITLGHLKWTLETFLKAFFERDDIVPSESETFTDENGQPAGQAARIGRWHDL